MLGDCSTIHAGGAHELFGGLSNKFASEGCPIFYRNSVVCFQEQIAFVLKTVILLAFGLGICEGVGEDSGHVFCNTQKYTLVVFGPV